MKRENIVIGILSTSGLLAVSAVCGLSFILSYDTLWSYALDGGKPEALAKFWPLIVDFPIVAFSLAAMLFAFLGSRLSWLPRAGVVIITSLTIYFNFTYAIAHSLNWRVAVMAPAMYAVSFECVILVIGLLTSRGISISKTNEIREALDNIQADWLTEQDNIETERGQLRGQLDNLKGQIEAAKQTMARLKDEQKEVSQQPTLGYLPDNLPVEVRQQIVKKMANDGQTIKAMADALGVSEGTIKGDKKAVANGNG